MKWCRRVAPVVFALSAVAAAVGTSAPAAADGTTSTTTTPVDEPGDTTTTTLADEPGDTTATATADEPGDTTATTLVEEPGDTTTTTAPEDPAPSEPPTTTAPASTTTTTTTTTTPPSHPARIETTPGATLPDAPDLPTGASDERAVITEILFNPAAVYDSRGEWFEIYNPSSTTLDLSGWTIGDETHDLHTIGALSVEPGGHAVLARHGDTARNGGVVAGYVYGDAMLLYNAGDRIVLRDADGYEVDRVDYSSGEFPQPEGRSISVIDPSLPNDDPSNWCTSTTAMPGGDLASPGRRTECSESPATIVITEVLANPAATSDYVGEWFELHNDGDQAVDLGGFTVQDDDGEAFRIDGAVVVPPGGYTVIGVSADAARNGNVDVAFAYGDAMRLHDTFDELVLLDPAGIQVDAVRWDDGRTFPDPNGASMHLLDPSLDNGDGANWCESARRWDAGDLGSPGSEGTCEPEPLPMVVITEVMFDPERTTSERQGEWFEIANVGEEHAVLDGFVLRTYSTSHVIGALTIAPGERAVLAVNGDETANGGIAVDYVYGTDLPLYNTTSTLKIEAPDGTALDHVKWSSALGFPNTPGHSIELRSTDAPNELGANWCISTVRYHSGDFGTPGVDGGCVERPLPIPLLISEVMRNPAAVYDSDGEWFEIHNPTGDAVDLVNWSVADRGSEHHVIAESVIVPADGFVVIGRSADLDRNGGVEVHYATGGAMVLINTEDEIVLSDPYGRVIDEVAWSLDGLMPRPNGASMARTPDALASFATSLDVSQWCVSGSQFGAGDRGTPGAANDCERDVNHDIVINEIHRDPKATADAKGEWVELHNTGDETIDLRGWTMRDDDRDSFVFDPNTPLPIEPGGYLVLGRNGPEINGGVAIDVRYGPDFTHFNTADEIVLLDADLTPIDRVAWTAVNGFPRVSGAAMALIDPTLDNAVGAHWCAAVTDQGNGDFGTPGAPNVCELEPEPDPALPTTLTHSAFAVGEGSCGGLGVAASKITLADPIRSNGSLKVAGSEVTLNGLVSHAGEVSIAPNASTPGGVVHDATVHPLPYGWTIDDFAPGGVRAAAAGAHYHHHPDGWTTNAGGIRAGVHFVEGDVVIQDSSIKLNEVTIVATGSITIHGTAIDLRPFAADLPVLFAAADACSSTGISVAGSSINWQGAIYAPSAKVSLRGSVVKTTNGATLGGSVLIEASKVQLAIQHPGSFVRVTAMCRADDLYKFRVRHEKGDVTLGYRLQIAGRVLHRGVVEVGETQYVWLDVSSKGVKVIPDGPWTNLYRGTASSNDVAC